ncbi:DUF350 domain-containing protein [Oceanospirillum sediminis]|uniref:DUF350 domain-containing protein n=1 Tax=Oceanospirillum sediminis TaxID=2760088 RepID=A0A839IT49_9GAMM|nr:DUF350 domain-containing protein [Oceanospirillum sediminis]MBB1487834.1 DUF350 domain-containing protein [Oceanospirillum sediminis]
MDIVTASLSGLFDFAVYFTLSLAALLAFKLIYTRITPHDEWYLIKEKQNTAAAWAFGGAILGFSIALASAASNSVGLADFIIWAIVALIAQLIAFAIIRFGFMPRIVERIEQDEAPAGIMLCLTSVSIGILNAACMTY